MEIAASNFMNGGEDDHQKKKDSTKSKRKQLGLSCMLNTEVGAVLAAIRRSPEFNPLYNISSSEESYDSSILSSLRSLRSLIFNPQQEWRTIDPSIYLSPFLDVIQSDDVPASATGCYNLPELEKTPQFEFTFNQRFKLRSRLQLRLCCVYRNYRQL